MNKPPLGIIPRRIHNLNRLKNISDAIERVTSAMKIVPDEWLFEFNEIVEYLNSQLLKAVKQ